MKRSALLALILAFCMALGLSSCSKKDGDVTVTSAQNSTEAATKDPGGDSGEPFDDGNLISSNFAGLEEKDFGDVSFSFIEEGAAKVLKQERIAFAENEIPTNEGQTWDAASGGWVKASDIKTSARMYTLDFSEKVTEGDLVITFQFKRGGGDKQYYAIKPKGASRTNSAVIFGNGRLTVGADNGKLASTQFYDVEVPANSWCDARITYSITTKGVVISAVISDEYGTVIASAVSDPITALTGNFSGIDLLDMSSENIADYGKDTPIHTTSVWYLKNLRAEANPMKTGDRVKLRYDSFTTTASSGLRINFLSINGENTIRPYFGRYSILSDCSGFLCGTADGRFYLYDIEKQELIYLDRAQPQPQDLCVYLNPDTGNVFYLQLNEKKCQVLYKMNIKTFEKTKLFEADDPNMYVYTEVTRDEMYTCYILGKGGGCSGGANASVPVGRINLATGTVDCVQQISFDRAFSLNHFMINPCYPELVMFKDGDGLSDKIYEDIHVLNFETGERITYQQPSTISAHAMWTYNGENVTLTDYYKGFQFTILTKDLTFVSRDALINGNHIMADASLTWALGDGDGVNMLNIKTGKNYFIVKDIGYAIPGASVPHPYQGHAEISQNGKLLLWGYTDKNGVLGIAWTINPEYTE